MKRKKRIIIWTAILLTGLLIIGILGFRIFLNNEMERWYTLSQQMALRIDATTRLQQNKLLVLQQAMKTYLNYESVNIVLPSRDSVNVDWKVYHGSRSDSLIILSPYALDRDELRSCELIIEGSYPYIKSLSSEFGSVIRLYFRLKTGQFIEYFYRDLPSDSEILTGLINTTERMRPITGDSRRVDVTKPFIGRISKKELVTHYTGLIYKDKVIGEICMDIGTNIGQTWMKMNLPDVNMVMFDSAGTIYTSNERRFVRDDSLQNIFRFLPDLSQVSFFKKQQGDSLISMLETRKHYICTHTIRHYITAIYFDKKTVRLSLFIQLIPFLLVFMALWAASWAYYNQRIITRQLRKISEELRLAKMEAESANHAKSVFLANMSHEIRTPMNAIIGFSQILSTIVRDPVQSNYIQSISNSGKTLLSLINDILDLSKIEAGKLEIRNSPFNIRQLLSEVRSLFVMKAEEKGISLMLETDDALPDIIVMDELRIRQILLNFMSNAMKFTDEGQVLLAAGILKKDDDVLDMKLSVKDTGIGIKKEQLGQIFGSFEQVENQDARKYGGTGLGLAITQKLVDMMGGRIEVDSEPMIGSTFRVIFPGIKIFHGELRTDSIEWEKLRNVSFDPATILVVDDVQDNRKVLAGMLTGLGLVVTEACNGNEALSMIRNGMPSMVLMDLRMPVMDGFTAVKEIRTDDSLSSLPVVAVSASAFHQDERDVKVKGFDGFLRKPVILEDLLAELCRFLPHRFAEAVDLASEAGLLPPVNMNPEDLKILLDVLSGEANRLAETALKKHSIQSARQLLAILDPMTSKYQWEPLINWVNSLKVAVDSFDITLMEQELRGFYALLESARSVDSKMNKD